MRHNPPTPPSRPPELSERLEDMHRLFEKTNRELDEVVEELVQVVRYLQDRPRRAVPRAPRGPQRFRDRREWIAANNRAEAELRPDFKVRTRLLAEQLGIGVRTWRRTRDWHDLRGLPPWPLESLAPKGGTVWRRGDG